MPDGSTMRTAPPAEELERFAVLAGALDPGQHKVLAGLLEAAQLLDAHGDQAGIDQLLEDAPTLLRAIKLWAADPDAT